MIYTILKPETDLSLILVEASSGNRKKMLDMVHWCMAQSGNGRFDYLYKDSAFDDAIWVFDKESDALLFRLRWL